MERRHGTTTETEYVDPSKVNLTPLLWPMPPIDLFAPAKGFDPAIATDGSSLKDTKCVQGRPLRQHPLKWA